MAIVYTGNPDGVQPPALQPAPYDSAGGNPQALLPVDADGSNFDSLVQPFELLCDFVAFMHRKQARVDQWAEDIQRFKNAIGTVGNLVDNMGIIGGDVSRLEEAWLWHDAKAAAGVGTFGPGAIPWYYGLAGSGLIDTVSPFGEPATAATAFTYRTRYLRMFITGLINDAVSCWYGPTAAGSGGFIMSTLGEAAWSFNASIQLAGAADPDKHDICFGMTSVPGLAVGAGTARICVRKLDTEANWVLEVADGAAITRIDTGVAIDGFRHRYRLEYWSTTQGNGTRAARLYQDGVLIATATTSLPSEVIPVQLTPYLGMKRTVAAGSSQTLTCGPLSIRSYA